MKVSQFVSFSDKQETQKSMSQHDSVYSASVCIGEAMCKCSDCVSVVACSVATVAVTTTVQAL